MPWGYSKAEADALKHKIDNRVARVEDTCREIDGLIVGNVTRRPYFEDALEQIRHEAELTKDSIDRMTRLEESHA